MKSKRVSPSKTWIIIRIWVVFDWHSVGSQGSNLSSGRKLRSDQIVDAQIDLRLANSLSWIWNQTTIISLDWLYRKRI